jgi:uncharacterized cupredoxin-like copper-binding protein
MRVAPAALGAVAVVLAVSACGRSSGTTSTPSGASKDAAPRIAVKVGDYSISLDREDAPRGDVTFDIRNDGGVAHEFVILKSDRAAAALPRAGDEVAEDAAGNKQDEAEGIWPGTTVRLKVTLKPGRYALICNLAGHYARGMHAAFRVT